MLHTDRVRLTLVAIVAVSALSGGRAYAQAPNSQPNPYRPGVWWGQLPSERKWGPVSAIEIDRDDSSIWVFERCGTGSCAGSDVAPVLKFDSSGKLLKSFGAGMFDTPHGIHVDRDGNVWVADGQSNKGGPKGHQVIKFSPEGEVLLRLGKAGVAGDGPDTFNYPSDVVTAPNGDIFVADGHGGKTNARIVKFSKDGKFIKAWGKSGMAPGEFEAPHGIAIDSRGRLFVADHRNARIQIFDQEGKFLEEWKQFGQPSGLSIDKNDILYVNDSTSGSVATHGVVFGLGVVTSVWKEGIRIGSAKDGKVMSFIPDPDFPDGSQDGVAADSKGNVYGGHLTPTNGQAAKKYVKK